jgi:hypothetical protein
MKFNTLVALKLTEHKVGDELARTSIEAAESR